MNIHEYQAKELFRAYGVAVPPGQLATTADEALAAAKTIGTAITVVKAQVHAGGRGKSGGVKVCKTPEAAAEAAKALLGTRLVTYQTDAKGQPVNSVYVEGGIAIARELYLAMLLDRSLGRVVLMVSTEGGMEIEEVAKNHPEKIFKETIDPGMGLMPYQARNLAFALKLKDTEVNNAVKFMLGLSKMYHELDCSMIEINPLVITQGGEVLALDGKVSFDDNALYRHKQVEALDDTTQHDPRETEAR
jgi:succinyl-CoA synthetase beta subunit